MFQNVRPAVLARPGPVCTVVIDGEEDFDWGHPGHGTDYSTSCMRQIVQLQEIFAAHRIAPAYLVTYPVLDDSEVVRLLRHYSGRGECDLGVQMHSWVTPPITLPLDAANSYGGNLPAGIEEQKLVTMQRRFEAVFGAAPRYFRAGRYGLGRHTARLLEKHGFEVDTSVAPRSDFSGSGVPDFGNYDSNPFWFGAERRVLELPLCRSLIGWAGQVAPWLYRLGATAAPSRCGALALLSRTRCSERVTLSPEGNDVGGMTRYLRGRLAAGQSVYSLSFHSSSLQPGRNPYVRSRAELHLFYDRLSAIIGIMRQDLGFEFVRLASLRPALGEGAA